MSSTPRTPAAASTPLRLLADQAFSRTAGAPLIGGNAVELLIDARANFDAWLAAIGAAQHAILFENYIFRDDALGRSVIAALAERAAAGVKVCVIRDWIGCLGQSGARLWRPLLAAGGEVRVYNPLRLAQPLGWINRDHRKLLVVDAEHGFLSGVCVSAAWLGDAQRGIAPWRDTGVAIRGPAVGDLVAAFADTWATLGDALPDDIAHPPRAAPAGEVELRVIATMPATAGLYRLDQLIAAMARRTLWLTDAYFVGMPPYVQALAAAARDGVDVRLLVPGASDIPAVASLSRAGYRALLEAGVRVFEWNGPMLHAKTAVADTRWARVGSSNLNLASWIGNCEIDIAVEDEGFATQMQAQYENDLANATEIVLRERRARPKQRWLRRRLHGSTGGSSGRAAAGAVRLANALGSAFKQQRVLGRAEGGALLTGALVLGLLAVVAILWPRLLAWPLALLLAWFGASLALRYRALRARTDDEARRRSPGPGLN